MAKQVQKGGGAVTPINNGGRPLTYDHLQSRKKSIIRKVTIPLDDELAERWQEITGRKEVSRLRLEMGIDNPEVRRQVVEDLATATADEDALKEEMGDNVAVFKFKSLGGKKFGKMREKYPPSDDHVAYAKSKGLVLDWNPDTFPPALLAACAVEPELTPEQAQELWESDEWSEGELNSLLEAALNANTQVRSINWGKG